MPLYICNAVKGLISDAAKPRIATDITDIHCDVTGAPRAFVHTFFFEDAPQQPLCGKSVFVFGSIRAGRTEEQKEALIMRVKDSVRKHTAIPLNEIIVDTTDVPASWVMEGGDVLPEPGEEQDWLKAHGAVTA